MALTDEERSALAYVELVGPVLQAIGSAAGVEEIHEVGNLLAKIPVEDIAQWFAKWRTDLIHIDAGTMTIGPGVAVVAATE
jgi:hypothetical protein